MLAKISFYLDKRSLNKEGQGHVKIAVRRDGKTAYILTGVLLRPDQWVNGTVTGTSNDRFLNSLLVKKKADVDTAYLELSTAGLCFQKDAREIADLIMERIDPDFAEERRQKREEEVLATNGFMSRFEQFYESKKNKGTKGLYKGTYNKILEYCADAATDAMKLHFEDVKPSWLESFEQFCLKTEKQNTAAIHLRNIRTVFNAAIDDEITSYYPFRKFKIKKEESRDKSFTAAELRALFDHKCYPGGEQEYVDMFKLMFCLIGINCIDLANLEKAVKGRAEYTRAKTHKFYSIKLQPEALEIVKRYEGDSRMLDILERCPNYKTYFNRMGKSLRKVGTVRMPGKKSEGKAILPDICTGSARTSWATIAQSELDIPRDVIAAALGHHTVDVTSTYLRTDWRKKVDEANRKVLDWVLYGKD